MRHFCISTIASPVSPSLHIKFLFFYQGCLQLSICKFLFPQSISKIPFVLSIHITCAVHIYVYVYIYIYIYIHTHMYVYVLLYMCVYIYMEKGDRKNKRTLRSTVPIWLWTHDPPRQLGLEPRLTALLTFIFPLICKSPSIDHQQMLENLSGFLGYLFPPVLSLLCW